MSTGPTLTRPDGTAPRGLVVDDERNLTELLSAAAARMGEDSAARERIEEMVDFFRFFERRMPELLEEWHQQRPRPPRA